MILRELRDQCALMVRDRSYREIDKEEWLLFFQSASLDARNGGWLVHVEDDETITLVNGTWDYEIPAPFVYITDIYLETRDSGVSRYLHRLDMWKPRLDGGRPIISFFHDWHLDPGRKIKIVGQAKPKIYVDENESIDRGMESFLRERALYFAFTYLGADMSEFARWRQQMAMQRWQSSEAALMRRSPENRQMPNSILVPGRG